MSKVFFLYFTLLSWQSFADDPQPKKFNLLSNSSEQIEAYREIAYSCSKGSEVVSYLHYSNNIEERYMGASALTYSYEKCLLAKDEYGCKDNKSKMITSSKLICTTSEVDENCTPNLNRLLSKLKLLGFVCTASGFN